MFANNIQKFTRVSENPSPPIHVPLVVGQNQYVISQYDVRRIEDSRVITYHQLGPKGEMIPVPVSDINLQEYLNNILLLKLDFEKKANLEQMKEVIEKIAYSRQSASVDYILNNLINHAIQKNPPFGFANLNAQLGVPNALPAPQTGATFMSPLANAGWKKTGW